MLVRQQRFMKSLLLFLMGVWAIWTLHSDPRESSLLASGAKEKPNAAIVYVLSKASQVSDLRLSIKALTANFNSVSGYPVYVLLNSSLPRIQTEIRKEFAEDDEIDTRALKFVDITIGIPETELAGIIPLYPEHYPSSAHFEQLVFHDLYAHPYLQKHDFIWKMSPDIVISSPLPYDPFEVMITRKCKYGYRNMKFTDFDKIVTLWSTAEMESSDGEIARFYKNRNAFPHLHRRISTGMINFDTRMEFVYLPAFKTVRESQISKAISNSKGIYEYRWSADTLRWLTLQLTLDTLEDVIAFCEIMYHGNQASNCTKTEEFDLSLASPIFSHKNNIKRTENQSPFITRDVEEKSRDRRITERPDRRARFREQRLEEQQRSFNSMFRNNDDDNGVLSPKPRRSSRLRIA